jgi:DNA gyrase/topoisomerase IV subunit A
MANNIPIESCHVQVRYLIHDVNAANIRADSKLEPRSKPRNNEPRKAQPQQQRAQALDTPSQLAELEIRALTAENKHLTQVIETSEKDKERVVNILKYLLRHGKVSLDECARDQINTELPNLLGNLGVKPSPTVTHDLDFSTAQDARLDIGHKAVNSEDHNGADISPAPGQNYASKTTDGRASVFEPQQPSDMPVMMPDPISDLSFSTDSSDSIDFDVWQFDSSLQSQDQDPFFSNMAIGVHNPTLIPNQNLVCNSQAPYWPLQNYAVHQMGHEGGVAQGSEAWQAGGPYQVTK